MDNSTYLSSFAETMSVEKNLSLKTVESYASDLRQFVKFINNASLIAVSASDLQSYVRSMFDKGYSNSTVLRKISALSSLYGFFVREGIIENSPALGLVSFKKKRVLPKFLDEDEICKLISAARKFDDNGRALAIVTMMYSSGVRVSELTSIKRNVIESMLKTQDGDFGYVIVKGKGDKERAVVFNGTAIEAIRAFLAKKKSDSQWLFPGADPRAPLTRQRIVQIFKVLAVDAGIDKTRLSPHVIRHSFATHLLNRNAEITFIQNQLGHSSVATTEIYMHLARDRLFSILKEHHPLSKKNLFEGDK